MALEFGIMLFASAPRQNHCVSILLLFKLHCDTVAVSKYLIRIERLAWDSSLLQTFINFGRKKIFSREGKYFLIIHPYVKIGDLIYC